MKKTAKNSHRYDGLCFPQRGSAAPRLVIFHAPVGEILKFAKIRSLGPGKHGAQREKKQAKVDAIGKFLEANGRNTIPTAIILAFKKGRVDLRPGANGCGPITIAGTGFAADVVDGQHRLLGINEFDAKMQIPVVGLLDADKVESAFQFLVVNNKSSRVATSHTKAVLAEMSGTSLAQRLMGARVAFDSEGISDVDLMNKDKDSPFFESVDWTMTPAGKRMVQVSALQLSFDYIDSLKVPGLEDRDVRRSVFLAIWKVVRKEWTKLWKPGSRLVSKVGIFCLTRFIIDMIVGWADNDQLNIDVTNLEQIETQTRQIIKKMNGRFWEVPWAANAQGGFDTTQGRERIVAAITQLYRNGKNDVDWWSEIDVIDHSAASN